MKKIVPGDLVSLRSVGWRPASMPMIVIGATRHGRARAWAMLPTGATVRVPAREIKRLGKAP